MSSSVFNPYLDVGRIFSLYSKLREIDIGVVSHETYSYVTGAMDALMVASGSENKLSRLVDLDINDEEQMKLIASDLSNFLDSIHDPEIIRIEEDEPESGTVTKVSE